MEQLIQARWFTWGLTLIITIPLLVIVIGELIERLRHHDSLYINFWIRLRNLTLPVSVVFFIMLGIFNVSRDTTSTKIAETILWAVAAYTLFVLVRIASWYSEQPGRWEDRIPGLFMGLGRALVIVVPLYYILSNIWGIELSELVTALGVGSLVIALALQDTLSNLVSGFLLIVDKPFVPGDWIEANGYTGQILDLNWRSVRLRTADRDVVIIPNSALSDTSIYNFTMLDPSYRDFISLSFSHDDQPNKVKTFIKKVAATSPHIMPTPKPKAFVVSHNGDGVDYELFYYVDVYESPFMSKRIKDDILTRIYYAAKRNGMSLYNYESEQPDPIELQQDIFEKLQTYLHVSSLTDLVLERLAQGASIRSYGQSERIVRAGEPSTGLFIVLSGQAELTVTSITGDELHVLSLLEGSMFGEMVLLGNRPNIATVIALEDLEVIYIPPHSLNKVIERHPRFVLDMERFIEDRMNSIRVVQGAEEIKLRQHVPSRNGKTNILPEKG